jgi:hypothetical protein
MGFLNISQPYRPAQPVTGIALFLNGTWWRTVHVKCHYVMRSTMSSPSIAGTTIFVFTASEYLFLFWGKVGSNFLYSYRTLEKPPFVCSGTLEKPPFLCVAVSERRVTAFHQFSGFISVRNALYEPIERTSDCLCGLCSGFLVTDPEVRLRFPSLPDSMRNRGSGTGSTQPHEYNWGATWKRK